MNLRHIFLIIGICGLLLNVVYDFIAYRENKIADRSGQDVIRQSRVENSLERLEHAIEILQLPPVTKSQFQRASLALACAQRLVTDPHELKTLADIQREVDARRTNPDMPKLVHEISFAESVRMQKQVEYDWEQNARVNHSLIEALIFDVALVLMLFIFFYFERRNQRKIERNFGASVNLLRESNSTLQDELARRQLALRTTVHDLKNPLSSIHGFAELLADEKDGNASIREFSELIRRISENSLQMINSLLFRVDDKPLGLVAVDIISLLKELCVQMDVQARGKGQVLISKFESARLNVHGNRMKLEELFSNLMSNAIKYSPRNKKIWLRVRDQDGFCRVEIEDQGPGFSADDKAAAFNLGRRLSARPTGGESSTGLGLFIAKQIAEQHKASITIADSSTGSGAVLVVDLPKFSYRILSNSESSMESGQRL